MGSTGLNADGKSLISAGSEFKLSKTTKYRLAEPFEENPHKPDVIKTIDITNGLTVMMITNWFSELIRMQSMMLIE